MSVDELRRPLTVIGAPTSAGSYAAGQEQAPRVLRGHGILERLRRAGREVTDAGNGPLQVWHPDPAHLFAQNFDAAADAVRAVAHMASSAFAADSDVFVMGGNCTVALAVMNAMVEQEPNAALVYVDRHFDLNTSESTSDGALDWMGMAAALGLLPDAPDFGFTRSPLLSPSGLRYVGVTADAATEWEHHQVRRLGIEWTTNDSLAAKPESEAALAKSWLGDRPFAVHFDLDVLDFIDLPLAENTDGRNSGPTLDAVTTFLRELCAAPGFRALSIGELNPARAAGTPDAIPRFVDAMGAVLA